MKYRTMVETARKSGVANENSMWKSIDRVDHLLDKMNSAHPDMVEKFLRKTYQDLYGRHYTKDMAEEDVMRLSYTDREGHTHVGAHWTKEEVLDAMKSYTFAKEVTEWDVWVAANVMYSDLCKVLTDDAIIKSTYDFFFGDEDFKDNDKIWVYETAMLY